MVARAYGRALSDEEIEDVYSAAWAAILSALRERGRRPQSVSFAPTSRIAMTVPR